MDARRQILLAGLEAIGASGLDRVAPRFVSGVGAILVFHHVRPARPCAFQPNRNLEITPEFLEELIEGIRDTGTEIVSLDEAYRRLTEEDFSQRFVVLTFDDGYRDNLEFAYPVLKRQGAPFTIFVASRFADGTGDLWWVTLERTIAASRHLSTEIDGTPYDFELTDAAAREHAFSTLYWALRALPDEIEMRGHIRRMANAADIETETTCRDFCMDWGEIADLASDPLVTVGTHTASHIMLAKASLTRARADIERGIARTEAMLGQRPEHFCYPVGDRTSAGVREFEMTAELGLKTALTTRRGVLHPQHCNHMTALPRISANGNHQKLRYFKTLLSGVPTALANGFAKVDAE